MNYTPRHRSSPGGLRRGGLLAVVAALHGVAFAAFLAAGTVRPELPETPLMARFIDPPKPVEVAPLVTQALPITVAKAPAAPPPAPDPPPPDPPKPKPVPKPVPKPRPRSVPKPVPKPIPPPALETTSSSEPAPADAAIMLAAEPAPAPAEKSGDMNVAADAAPNVAAGASQGGGTGTGPVIGARFNAGYLNNPEPPYPPQSRRLGEEGKVVLRVLVSAEGFALQVELDASSGSDRLDKSALDTVRKWRFIPASRGGAAIESWVLVPILFRLEQ
jgi:protein TonB